MPTTDQADGDETPFLEVGGPDSGPHCMTDRESIWECCLNHSNDDHNDRYSCPLQSHKKPVFH